MAAMATVFGSLLWLMMGAFVAGEAASRDVDTNMYSIIYTAPITKAQYLGGKFLAALTINIAMLSAVQVAILLGIYLPGVHPSSIGLLRPAAFLTAFCYIALPNAFFTTVVQFFFALRSGRPIVAYMASLALFFMAFFIASLILFKSGMGTVLDPIGIRFIWQDLSHLWTTFQKKLAAPSIERRVLTKPVGVDCHRPGARYIDLYKLSFLTSRPRNKLAEPDHSLEEIQIDPQRHPAP